MDRAPDFEENSERNAFIHLYSSGYWSLYPAFTFVSVSYTHLFLPLSSIRPNPAQPRTLFDAQGLQELAASIRQYGVLQPLTCLLYTSLPLLEDGVQDLKLAAARGVYPSPDGFTFVTSGMLRANQTLRGIYGDVPLSGIDDLREVNFGIFEMKSYEDLKTDPVYQDWLAGDWFRNVPPGGESFADSEARLLRGLDELLSRKDNTCLLYTSYSFVIVCMLRILLSDALRQRHLAYISLTGYIIHDLLPKGCRSPSKDKK